HDPQRNHPGWERRRCAGRRAIRRSLGTDGCATGGGGRGGMMTDKRFQNVDILKELAAQMPTQRAPVEPARPRPVPVPAAPAEAPGEPQVQISFSARFSTRKRMFQVARDHDMTLKALILGALREKYPALGIEDADLVDLRAKKSR